MECVTKFQPSVRKGKKKQVKDELDRLKQAEKKKRRLEKALATSAAIRTELEKKKEKKKEEQKRLDEEGAAIAEAVALHVLIGEDSDNDDDDSNVDVFLGGGRMGGRAILPFHRWGPNSQGLGLNNDWSVLHHPQPIMENHLYPAYVDGRRRRGLEGAQISAGLIASQAVASLHLTEDVHVDSYFLNRVFHG
ncbi:uncharacterized protein LOC124929419 [Impatiens glandulifera]|uniref:uncharacterized protein LOC124929419 n=1 Tax=Impatiens glandulifera TaxID=253017 RepID=UPI001FB08670|nr:uncharacterized protein LOC124929419 [Impatiens glandulifera]